MDKNATWGDYEEVAPHVFARLDAEGRERRVLSAEKTWELLRLNRLRQLLDTPMPMCEI